MMAGDPIELAAFRKLKGQTEELATEDPALKSGDGDGTSGDMDGRVSKLEVHMEYMRNDLGEIKTDLKSALDQLRTLPTRSDLWAWKWQWTALAVGTMAIVIGGIIGGLSWIKPDAPVVAPQPIVIQAPPPLPVSPPSP
jgi:hypothetical protein